MPKRVDANQATIISALRHAGASVTDVHAFGHGFPDIAVGFRGEDFLMEIKSGPREPLTPDELRWHGTWVGRQLVIWSPAMALAAIGLHAAPVPKLARNFAQTRGR